MHSYFVQLKRSIAFFVAAVVSAAGLVPVLVAEAVWYPNVALYGSPYTVQAGGTSKLSWSAVNSTSCAGTAGDSSWIGPKPVRGTFTVKPSKTTVYTITCKNAYGKKSDSVEITVKAAPVLSPTPAPVPQPVASQPMPATTTVSQPAPAPAPAPSSNALFSDNFDSYTSGSIITDETIFWSKAPNPTPWEMDSGVLYAQSGQGATGVPSALNNNGVFRLNTKDKNFGNVKVAFDFTMNGLTTTPSTPATDWDGAHVFLRYQSEYNLYYASFSRRDGSVVIKKKVQGGSSNGGTYYNISNYVKAPFPTGQKARVEATVQNLAGGGVEIKLYVNGTLVVSGIDDGTKGPVITQGGATGIRGDNANFTFDNFTVSPLN